jgi:hypothetical protein
MLREIGYCPKCQLQALLDGGGMCVSALWRGTLAGVATQCRLHACCRSMIYCLTGCLVVCWTSHRRGLSIIYTMLHLDNFSACLRAYLTGHLLSCLMVIFEQFVPVGEGLNAHARKNHDRPERRCLYRR